VSERNKVLVRSFIERYNASDWAALDAMVAQDYVHHAGGAALTWAQFKRGAAWLRAGMPDFRLAIRDMVAESDRVAVRLEGRGTHTGPLFGETPTGVVVTIHVQWLCLFENDLLAEDWEAADEWDLRSQVGALPSATEAPAT
jgi:predicted ester cyclase